MTSKESSTREQAIAWWNNLSPYDEQHSLREKYFGYERLTSSLTGREIEEIWRKEVNVHLTHCFQGEYKDSCKYGESDCPTAQNKELTKSNQKQLIVELMEEDSKDGLYDIPLQECVNCNEQKQVHLMCLDCCIKLGNQNQTETSEPNPQLIESMSYRYRHDFGLLQDDKKNVIRTIMKQLWEEVVGKGFYKPTKHQVPDVRKMVEWIDREILLNPHYADSPRLKEGANMVKVKLQQYTPTSSQTEISDEEIEAQANYLYVIEDEIDACINGAKWYREQLKKK